MTRFTAEAVGALPGPAWLQERRAAAFERFSNADLPTESEEIWRYSRIDDLDLDAFEPSSDDTAPAADPKGSSAVAAAISDAAAVVVVRGGLVTVSGADAGRGVRVVPIAEAGDAVAVGSVLGDGDAFTALHDAFVSGGVLVDVPRGVAVERPIVIVHVVDGAGRASFPRTFVRAGEASEVTVVEHVVSGTGGPSLVVPVVELDVAAAANVRYCNVQQLGREAWQLAYQASRVGQQATLHSTTIALGGDYARLRTDSHLVGEGATANLMALYFGDGEQMHDFRTLQAHEAPKTTSDLLFKGAVAGTSHAVYTGLIKVARGASGTNAFQTNRNLVLSEGARADSVPNLEIEENDVRCSHASAVGPIDEEQRYYLEARGIPTEEAERLIVLGFLGDLVERLPVPELRAPLRAAVAAKLDRELV